MPVRLIESLATTEKLAELFSDQSVLQAMLDFEAALARVERRAGIVPHVAAETIAAAAKAENFDIAALSHDALRSGTLAIPVVKALTERVRASNPAAAGFVHWGATSQDVVDTAMVRLLKRAHSVLTSDLSRLQTSLRSVSAKYKDTVMLGRTLLQAATPITFGLKVAGWFGAVQRGTYRLDEAFAQALIVQFGGATGTLASLGEHGSAVACELANELGLAQAEAPWHTHRDRLASLICSCGVLTGSLGKIARDISLLAQSEVAEVAEPSAPGRGGSSTMPHKRNPVGCVVTLAAAQRVPGLVATFLSSMVQEHERSAGAWQSEWPVVASVVGATGLAAASMAEVVEGLSVDVSRMRANIESTKGVIFAERTMMLLASQLGREAAHNLVEDATRKSIMRGEHLSETLAKMPKVSSEIESPVLQQIEVPEQYLGSAEVFRRALLDSSYLNKPQNKKEQ